MGRVGGPDSTKLDIIFSYPALFRLLQNFLFITNQSALHFVGILRSWQSFRIDTSIYQHISDGSVIVDMFSLDWIFVHEDPCSEHLALSFLQQGLWLLC